jgi:uroporphyrinogen-III synthase
VTSVSFDGRRVLTLESRRATELSALIANHGGRPISAPALREVPLVTNTDALEFIRRLVAGQYDVVVFLTGVGARALVELAGHEYSRRAFADALSNTKVVVRGPKSMAAMRELQVAVWAAAPEPNTWHDVMATIIGAAGERLDSVRVAVQEYGVSNPELLDALRARGATVTPVPVYRWALPEDIQPLRDAVAALARGEVDVALFTTSTQLVHLWQIAVELGLEEEVRRGLDQALIASIGPTTSRELQGRGFRVDLEASHPKMGVLVREAAARAGR